MVKATCFASHDRGAISAMEQLVRFVHCFFLFFFVVFFRFYNLDTG